MHLFSCVVIPMWGTVSTRNDNIERRTASELTILSVLVGKKKIFSKPAKIQFKVLYALEGSLQFPLCRISNQSL